MSQPQFTIGISTYRRPELLKAAIQSVLRQDFVDFEVLVGNDDVQTALSLAGLGIVDPRVRILNYPKNLGEIGNMNTLLAESSGRYFLWMADDDLHRPNLLSSVNRAITKTGGEPTAVYVSFESFVDDQLPSMEKAEEVEPHVLTGREFLAEYFRDTIRTIGTYGVFRKDYLLGAGGVSQLSKSMFAIYGEYLLILQSALQDRVLFINSPLILYRFHSNSWGCSNTEAEIYSEAGIELMKKGLPVLSQPSLSRDLSRNIESLMKLIMTYFVAKVSQADRKNFGRRVRVLSNALEEEARRTTSPESAAEIEEMLASYRKWISMKKLRMRMKLILPPEVRELVVRIKQKFSQ